VSNIEYAKQEKSKVELSSRERLLLKIIILFECVALCFIIAAIVCILLPKKELPVINQDFYAEKYGMERSEQLPESQEEQIKVQLNQEQAQTNNPAEQEKEEDIQSEIMQEQKSQQKLGNQQHQSQQQTVDKESHAPDANEPFLQKSEPNSATEGEKTQNNKVQETKVAGAVYPESSAGSGIDSKSDIDPNIDFKSDIDPDKPMIALTFDDGPYEAVTNRILDILELHNARATFFVLGLQVKTHAETLQRIYSLGCQIGNHSYNHKNLHSLSVDEIHKEIEDTNNLIREIIGIDVNIVRPPYGAPNDYLKEVIPYPLVLWCVDPKDWKSLDKEAIINEVVGKVKDGDIVILHDTYPTTADACEVIIPKLIEEGYQLVTVEEMMKYRNITMVPGKAYYNAHKK